ncbi:MULTISPECIES: hypothetical protein [Caulobacter]|uniref:Uncharacterized protein n=1 Tax=Caulobacter rhizosphaerae TaxID=2010972 RepID=A0ABU1MVC7_9CAUL|nr:MULTISPECIES: hypothetical protein [Caulobacter]KQZ31409.1 hypothetical protein ASD47_16335 [Caulobacter sp. Root1472]MDR6529987.1 hypothetical protein [Caulobacter rhizosphaerae]
MGDETNREGLQQQPSDDQRRQSDQQNQQGQRDPRRDGEGVEGEGVDDLNNGLEGGVDTGAIEPGRTDQP